MSKFDKQLSPIAINEAQKILDAYDVECRKLEAQLTATLLLRKSLSECIDYALSNGLKAIEL